MGEHEKRGSSTEDAGRKKHRSKDRSHHRESSKVSTDSRTVHRDSKESRQDSTESRQAPNMPLQPVDTNVNKDGVHADATGSTRDEPQPGPSSSSTQRDDRLDELYSIMGTIIAKINSMDNSAEHVLSDSDSEGEAEHHASCEDPMDHLSTIFNNDSSQPQETSADLSKALADFTEGFSSKEEKGAPIHKAYATVLNDSLRNKPHDANLKALVQSIKLPENVPNLTVPATNADITKAINSNGKLLDTQLFRTNGLIARAIIPLATFVAEVGEEQAKPINSYFTAINNSVRLLAAAFNYINQSRKEVIRMNVREQGLPGLCKWDCPVGQDELFPFDVTKRCDEIGKVRTLGSSFRMSSKPRFQPRRPSGDFKWPPKRFERRSSPGPYSTKGKGKQSSKPFLGKKGLSDRHKKRF